MMTAVALANAAKSKNIYIIDGYFFYEIPMDKSMITGMMSIQTANGTKALGLLIKEPLSEDASEFAIQESEIPEADILLDMYKERRNMMSVTSKSREDMIKQGDIFPEFQARDIDGRVWNNKDVEGKVMVLNCWFTGCGPCRAEMQELSGWKNELPDVMFFSSTFEKPEIAKPVIEKTGFNWIHLVNDTQFKVYIGSNGYPLTVVVGKDGIIALTEYGTSPLQRKKIRETIESLR